MPTTAINKSDWVGTKAQYVALSSIETNRKYYITDLETFVITNSAMASALTTYSALYSDGDVFLCIDSGTYTQNAFYKLTSGAWVKLGELVSSSEKTTWNSKLDEKPDGTNDLISNNKITNTYLPDFLLGQVFYGGNVTTDAVATLTTNAKSKLGTSSNSITLTNDTTAITGYEANNGIYYIATADFTFAGLSILTGDWLISRGNAWDKIDNTDAVTGVKGNAENSYRIGNVDIDPDDLDDTNTTNKFVTATDKTNWSGKQDAIDSSHKLSADLVDDSSATNKFVTATDKTTWSGKQDVLVSGTNIKTINNESILGSGNIIISGSGMVSSVNNKTGNVVLDPDDLDDTNTTNKFVSATEKSTWNGKQDLIDSTHKLDYSLVDNTPTLGTAAACNTGTSSGNVPVLDSNGKLNSSVLPEIAITDTNVVATEAAMLALTAQTGDVCVRSDLNKSFILTAEPASTLANWQELLTPTDAVLSVNSKTGTVVLDADDISDSSTTNKFVTATDKTNWNSKQAGNSKLTSISGLSNSSTGLIKLTNGTASLDTTAYTTNTGTVTSVTIKAGTGISLNSETAITGSGSRTITNAGVRSISTGSTNGTISVNTNGTSADVAVKGLGSNAYTSTTIPTKTSQLTNDSGFLTSAPVTSVSGRTGAITAANLISDMLTGNASYGDKIVGKSIGQNGYIYYQSGLCIQWGRTSYGSSNSNNTNITFPTTFTNVYSVVATWQKGDNTTREWNIYGEPTTTGFTVRRNSSSDSSCGWSWMAIGKK